MRLAGTRQYDVPLPIGPLSNILSFQPRLRSLVDRGDTRLTMQLSLDEVHDVIKDIRGIEAACNLIGQPGFPGLQMHRVTPSTVWFILTKSEQAGLIVAAMTLQLGQPLHELYCQGLLNWKVELKLLGCVEVTLDWSGSLPQATAQEA